MEMGLTVQSYVEQFVENALDDIEHGYMDTVIQELNKMSSRKAMACAVFLTIRMTEQDDPQFLTFLQRLEDQL